ncbi:MAG TPA: hypothetical protein VMS17_13280 [Gemmataceae bacterium]|nr:hypothetical protein [Gemmataceae bacterium]
MKTSALAVASWFLLPCLGPAAPAPEEKVPPDSQAVLDDIGVPPLPGSPATDSPSFQPFTREQAEKYAPGGDDSDLRKAVRKARVLLWAISDMPAPKNVAEDVAAARKRLSIQLPGLTDAYHQPANENKFKEQVETDERAVASLMAEVDDELEGLRTAGQKRGQETARWQANYDLMLARLETEYVFLLEYQSMLGQMRKEVPPLAAGQNGWKLVPQTAVHGDAEGKKLAREARKLLDTVMQNHPGTPWDVLAQQYKAAPLSVQWQGVTIK